MGVQQKNQNSLHSRVNDYLRGKPIADVAEAPEAAAVEAIFEMLQKAEAELKAVQHRVDRLKWELAKAKK